MKHLKSIQLMILFIILSAPVYATDEIGEIAIGGEIVPPEILAYYYIKTSDGLFKKCESTKGKESAIDVLVSALQYEVEFGRNNDSGQSLMKDLQNAMAKFSEKPSSEDIEQSISEYTKNSFDYLRYVKVREFQTNLVEEYQKRVRDKDPNITNLTVARVLEINRPDGPNADDKLFELATDIKNGVPFEEAATKYPSRYSIQHQSDSWIVLDSLPHEIDKNSVQAGDIIGIENILSFDNYHETLLKVYEIKTLAQVRLSDQITSVKSRRPRDSNYLRDYLFDKLAERRKHFIMSELWAKHNITEDGEPIIRVGNYRPCESY